MVTRSLAGWVSSWEHVSGAAVDIASTSCADSSLLFLQSPFLRHLEDFDHMYLFCSESLL